MSLYESVQNQIKESFVFISNEYSDDLLQRVLRPDRVMEFHIPVKMDDGTTKVFAAYRSQHNNAKGPYKGGLRFHQNVSKDEVMSLSAWMSLKTSVVGIPLGGGKGGIIVDPKLLSKGELERLSRGFAAKLTPFIGKEVDVPAPDVNTTGEIMAWMVDEYSKLVGVWTPGVITGKPLSIGGSQGREKATSLGGCFTIDEYFKNSGQSLAGKTIAIQGAGNVGLNFATLIVHNYGAKVVAISDSRGGIYNPDGLDVDQIEKLKSENKSVSEYSNASQISNDDLLLLNVDILVPSALEQVIHADNADKIQAKVILELANGPVTPQADKILTSKNIPVLPDVLANAGGVTVSYFEQVQNNTNYYRPESEVNEKLEAIMRPATLAAIQTAEKYNTTLRNGAYIVSLRRILEAMKVRG
ncbi:Glu/Leu/Phe/Val dehydrogenase [Candidatus Gracilibacteria bacterium]|nr:Glu/Leu/Phe/Val dehydrogenase [Candidatus Gracilibacteria bacterium]